MNPKRKISQFDLDGNFIKTFDSVRAAAKQFGGKESDHVKITDSQRYRGKKAPKKVALGFLWEYEEK